MSTPIDRNDGKALTDIVTNTVARAKAQANQRGDVPEWAIAAYTAGMVAGAVARAVAPDEYVLVLRDDLRVALDDWFQYSHSETVYPDGDVDESIWGDGLFDAYARLTAALDDGENVTEGDTP